MVERLEGDVILGCDVGEIRGKERFTLLVCLSGSMSFSYWPTQDLVSAKPKDAKATLVK
jgi:hypothetical protein